MLKLNNFSSFAVVGLVLSFSIVFGACESEPMPPLSSQKSRLISSSEAGSESNLESNSSSGSSSVVNQDPVIEVPTTALEAQAVRVTDIEVFSGAVTVAVPLINSPPATEVSRPSRNIQGLALGENHSCALAEGRVWCWGSNSHGQLGSRAIGIGNGSESNGPVEVPITDEVGNVAFDNVDFIAAGGNSTCAIRRGQLYCWGKLHGLYLGLDRDNITDFRMPHRIDRVLGWVTSVSLGKEHVCVKIHPGSHRQLDPGVYGYCFGKNTTMQLTQDSEQPRVYLGSSGFQALKLQPGWISIDQVIAGPMYTCLQVSRRVDSTRPNTTSLMCIGQNSDDWRKSDHNRLNKIRWIDQAVAYLQTYIPLTQDIQNELQVLRNQKSNIESHMNYEQTERLNTRMSRSQIEGHFTSQWVSIPDLDSVLIQSIGTGRKHLCAVAGGSVYCMGDHTFGQTGINVPNSRANLIRVWGLAHSVTQIVSGNNFNCALQNGAVKCFGNNASQQIGSLQEHPTFLNVPATVIGLETGVTHLAAGDRHACAVRNNQIYCWGNHSYGKLGPWVPVDSAMPVLVPAF